MEESRFDLFSSLAESSLKSISKIKSVIMESFGLSGTHTRCLTALLSDGPLTQNQLAEHVGMDRSQVSRILKDMLEKSYVTDSGEAGYKRQYALTEIGQKYALQLREAILRVNHFVSDNIPAEDIAVFYRTFEAISRGLKDAVQQFSTVDSFQDM